MKRIGSAAMLLPILAAILVSVVALGVLWLAPVAGLALMGAGAARDVVPRG